VAKPKQLNKKQLNKKQSPRHPELVEGKKIPLIH
jgi:hypothetical protein